MLKQIIAACGGLVLSAGMTLAVDVSGVYSGGNNGQAVTVTLSSDNGTVRGQVEVGGGTMPLVGRESDGAIQGVWRNAQGQDVPFIAQSGPGGMQLQTNGVTYALAKGQTAAAPVQMNPQNMAQVMPAGGAEQQLEIRRGASMECAVPAGWQFSATNNGVDTLAPDGITLMSRVYLHGIGRIGPDQYLQRSSRNWANLGISNIQVVSSKDLAPTSKLYEMDYLSHGRPAHAIVQVTINPGPGGYMATMITLQGARESFQQNVGLLKTMAESVRVVDANSFADGGEMNRQAIKRTQIATQSARDVGNIIINGEAARGHLRDESFKGADDTLRDVTRFKDAGGNEYTAPLQAVRAFQYGDGSASYTSSVTTPVPHGAAEMKAYDYSGH